MIVKFQRQLYPRWIVNSLMNAWNLWKIQVVTKWHSTSSKIWKFSEDFLRWSPFLFTCRVYRNVFMTFQTSMTAFFFARKSFKTKTNSQYVFVLCLQIYLDCNHFHNIFETFLMFYQFFFSPQVKWCVILTHKLINMVYTSYRTT